SSAVRRLTTAIGCFGFHSSRTSRREQKQIGRGSPRPAAWLPKSSERPDVVLQRSASGATRTVARCPQMLRACHSHRTFNLARIGPLPAPRFGHTPRLIALDTAQDLASAGTDITSDRFMRQYVEGGGSTGR